MDFTIGRLLYILKHTWKSLVLFGLLLGAISFFVFVVTQKNFRSHLDLLVIQNQNGFSDYYALSKSADFLSGILIESIYSEKFIDEMENSGLPVSSFLPEDKIKRLEIWKKSVSITKNPNLGMISIDILGDNRNQLSNTSDTVIDILIKKNYLFLGKGQDLDVRVLNGPIIEKNPSVSQMIAISFGGFVIGILFFLIWAFYKDLSFRKNP